MKTLEKYKTKPIAGAIIGLGFLLMFPMLFSDKEPSNFAIFLIVLSIPVLIIGLVYQLAQWSRHNANIRKYKQEMLKEGVFRFKLENPTTDLLQCEKGEAVNFWQPADDKSKMLFYAKGTFQGEGLLGNAPKEWVKFINTVQAKGLKLQVFAFGDEIEVKVIDLKKELASKR